jgi:magnesium-transporting ATPase (P-type)
MNIYEFIIIVVIPSLICFITNILIFNYVRSSTNRVHPSSLVANNKQHQSISRRDLHLIRHLIIMFCIFVGGWSSIYIYSLIDPGHSNSTIFFILLVLSELSLLIDILDLFLYNHEVRRYLFKQIFRC